MTTYISFTPSAVANFQFQPTLDGNTYVCVVKWNLSGKRYFVECSNLNGNLIFNLPLIGSPDNYDISMTAGYFNTKLLYRESTAQFEVT